MRCARQQLTQAPRESQLSGNLEVSGQTIKFQEPALVKGKNFTSELRGHLRSYIKFIHQCGRAGPTRAANFTETARALLASWARLWAKLLCETEKSALLAKSCRACFVLLYSDCHLIQQLSYGT